MKNIILALSVPMLANLAIAGPVTTDGSCSPSNPEINSVLSKVQITSIQEMVFDGSGFVPSGTNIAGSYPINSTSCLGFVTSPDNDWGQSPSPNIGALGDGLLNEEILTSRKGGTTQEYFVPGEYFLTHANDSMVDLDGDGDKTDPGWIRLGGVGDIDAGWDFNYDSVNNFNLDEVLDITFGIDVNGQGFWSMDVDPSAIEAATRELGRPSVFDHLAFVLKGSNNQEASWAIFDFNFHEMIDDGLDFSLGDTAYSFDGLWDAGVINGQALSHFSIWAHDPPLSGEIPVPAPLFLFGAGLLALGFAYRQK